ncbi:MAG TPA: hypothetical protein VL178_04185 [Pseudomonas sp.]|nr:hypothetical protein [Pseudomonas sp.]
MKPKAKVTAVRFTHDGYKIALMVFLGVLFVLNSLALLVGVTSSLVPVVIQGALLWMIVGAYRKVRLLVQVWCVVLVASGLYGGVSRLLAPELNVIAMGREFLVAAFAAYFLIFASRYIKDVTQQ